MQIPETIPTKIAKAIAISAGLVCFLLGLLVASPGPNQPRAQPSSSAVPAFTQKTDGTSCLIYENENKVVVRF